ncbi:MAG: peptidase S10, partial [Bryobacteraceae bacterium]
GRYDGRLVGPSALNVGETSDFDPSSSLITPPFTAMFTNYVRNELGYKTDLYYYPLGGIQSWDYGVQNGFGDTTSLLRGAMTKNPYMKVMVVAGYFDLATPYYAVEHTFNHMGLNAEMHKNITWSFYQAGHMLYIDGDSHTKLKRDVGEFISNSLPKREAQ